MKYLRVLADWLLLIAACCFLVVTYPLITLFDKPQNDNE